MSNIAYIALGSNLNHPQQQITSALRHIHAQDHVTLQHQSYLYQSEAMGDINQPDYINAVVQVSTTLSANDLLMTLQQIELQHHRVRNDYRWGPRTLDLDILLYNNQVINTDTLIIPHYDLKNRSFFIVPLSDIAPNLVLPCGTAIASLLHTSHFQELKRIISEKL